MSDEYDDMNKPALVEECKNRGLETTGQTALDLRGLLRFNDSREIYDCDTCHYFEEDVVLKDFIKAAGNMRGDVCRQFKCWIRPKLKGCPEYINREEASDPNQGLTSDARKNAFHSDSIN